MYDEWLVSRLSKNAWALLGALLLLRRPESQLSAQELMLRAGLSKNTFHMARSELQIKGYIDVVEQGGGKSPIIRLKGVSVEEVIPEVKRVEAEVPKELPSPKRDEIQEIIDEFAKHFPDENSLYPLSRAGAGKFLRASGEDVERVLLAIEKASANQPRHPKAYVEALCRNDSPTNKSDEGDEPPSPELLEFTERAKRNAARTGGVPKRRLPVERKG